MLKVTNLSKSYKLPHEQIEVLRNANLTVAPGETVAIVGRSGAGKSTLLHVIGGLDKPQQGEVFIHGQSIYALSARKRAMLRAAKIGFVFQAYHLLPEMDIVENVMLPAMALGQLSRKEMYERAKILLIRMDLGHRLNHTPLELSGGEQQRAAIARALMNNPPLILADEPTGNLDRMTGGQILDLLLDFSQEEARSVVMVTHSPETAAQCHRTLCLQDGQLIPSTQITVDTEREKTE